MLSVMHAKHHHLRDTDPIELRRISCEVPCDPRSVRRELEHPGSVRGIVGDRLRAVLQRYTAEVDLNTKETP